jgi:hypothetical protein
VQLSRKGDRQVLRPVAPFHGGRRATPAAYHQAAIPRPAARALHLPAESNIRWSACSATESTCQILMHLLKLFRKPGSQEQACQALDRSETDALQGAARHSAGTNHPGWMHPLPDRSVLDHLSGHATCMRYWQHLPVSILLKSR